MAIPCVHGVRARATAGRWSDVSGIIGLIPCKPYTRVCDYVAAMQAFGNLRWV